MTKTIDLIMMQQSEVLIIDDEVKILKPLSIINIFIDLCKAVLYPDVNTFLIKFHSMFYELDKHSNHLNIVIKAFEPGHPPVIEDVPINFNKSSIENLKYEAYLLETACKCWLNYNPKSKPSERFQAFFEVANKFTDKQYIQNYGEYNSFIEVIQNSFPESLPLDLTYKAYNQRSELVKKQLTVRDNELTLQYQTKGSLLPLAWMEIEYLIQRNSYVKCCPVCKHWFKLVKGKSTRKKDGNTINSAYHCTRQIYCSEKCRKAAVTDYLSLYNMVNQQIHRIKDEDKKKKLREIRKDLSRDWKNGTVDLKTYVSKYYNVTGSNNRRRKIHNETEIHKKS